MAKNKKKSSKKNNNASVAAKQEKVDDLPVENDSEQNTVSKEINEVVIDEKDKSLEDELKEASEENRKEQSVSPENSSTNIQVLKEEILKLKSQLEHPSDAVTTVADPETASVKHYVEQLKKVQDERDEFETKYDALLSRLSGMKTIFSKMKESQEELEITKDQLTEYETQNMKLKEKVASIKKEKNELTSTVSTLNREMANLESECERLQTNCKDYENQIKDIEDRMEKSSSKHIEEVKHLQNENNKLIDENQELSNVLNNHKQDYQTLKEENEDVKQELEKIRTQRIVAEETIKEIEGKLEENTKASIDEIKEKDLEINALRVQLDSQIEVEKKNREDIIQLHDKIEKMKVDVELKAKYEKETKDQALQMGKLRHEAIILNEHLRKALGMLKESSDSEMVDKELISNLLISFVSIPRADPKKFEVLQLLSNFLNWDDDKKQQAGLMHNPEKSALGSNPVSRTQSFVALWTDFLEKESER